MSQKNKKRGKNTKSKGEGQKREMIFAEENQMYAIVEKMLGNCRLTAKCMDGKNRICHIRGKMRKRIWIKEDSVILIGMRDFDDDKADVIHGYQPDEVRRLISYGELPELSGNSNDKNNMDNITWESGLDDSIVKLSETGIEPVEKISDGKEIDDL